MGLWLARLTGLTALFACSPGNPDTQELHVYGAASCVALGHTVQAEWTGGGLRYQWGSSAALARQILDGAPAHVFLSADEKWVEELRDAERLHSDPVEFARGRLVCIAFEKGAGAFHGANDLRAVANRLTPGDRFAIGDPGVPVGEYARQAISAQNAQTELQPYLVGQTDARSVLQAVRSGQAQAGIVYHSDAADAGVSMLFELPQEAHDPIRYWACALRQQDPLQTVHPDAQPYLDFLRSEPGRSILSRLHFD